MKISALTILTLLSPTSTFALEPTIPAPSGHFGSGHSELHPFYQGLAQPGMSPGSCCSDQDYRPTQWRLKGAHVEVQIEGKWCPVPAEKILPISAPDGNAHICTSPPQTGADPCNVTIFCVIIGDGT